ncbi:MAG: hypothetical protein BMS9Abin15_0915 [Gammaproteobacteria bacterium]|nr:MAG: hypothetical protein BMS9Abin15_0915 [Gammaproteobacteria bacterium]
MLTLNVYDRVFFVRGVKYGTAFTVDVDGKQYLVSARHVINSDCDLKIFHDRKWKQCPFTLVGSGEGEADITVLAPRHRLSSEIPLDPAIGNFIIGQDVYFVGYPYKMWSEGGDVMSGRPLPFVKKGTISAGMDPTDDVKRLYVDAINNEGFSGGPLVVAKPNTIDYRVIGKKGTVPFYLTVKGACHLFRHSMATQMLENGADIRYIQAILGHKDLNSTQIYTRVCISKLKAVHAATHPCRL